MHACKHACMHACFMNVMQTSFATLVSTEKHNAWSCMLWMSCMRKHSRKNTTKKTGHSKIPRCEPTFACMKHTTNATAFRKKNCSNPARRASGVTTPHFNPAKSMPHIWLKHHRGNKIKQIAIITTPESAIPVMALGDTLWAKCSWCGSAMIFQKNMLKHSTMYMLDHVGT